MKRKPTITVTWVESCGPTDIWLTDAQVKGCKPPHIETVGFLYHETPEAVTIISTIGENGQLSGCICIPKVAILTRSD